MFQSAFQNNAFFEIFDSKGFKQQYNLDAQNKANKEKEKFYLQLYKVSSANMIKNFDKIMKNYVLDLEGHNNKMQLPKEGELALVQQFLCFQIYIPQTQSWTLEFTITDTQKTKRHVYMSQNCKQIEKKPFHLKYPYEIPKNIWLNLQIDLYSFMNGWRGQTFRSLDLILICAPCRLRRIFTMKQCDQDGSVIPKNLQYPPGFEYQNHIIQFIDGVDSSQDNLIMKVTSKKVTGFSQQSQQSQKAQKTTQEKIVKNNIVFDDHPTPKRKTPLQSNQKPQQFNDQVVESNEFEISAKQISRYSKISKTDSMRKQSAPKKEIPKPHELKSSKSVPRKQLIPEKKPIKQQEDDYYMKTQKFTTLNEPLIMSQNLQFQNNGEEIEEFIEEDFQPKNNQQIKIMKVEFIESPTQRPKQQQTSLKQSYIGKEQQAEKVEKLKKDEKKEVFEESQKRTGQQFNKRSISELKNESRVQEVNVEDSLESTQNGFYAAQMKKYTNLQRPFTPEYGVQFNFKPKGRDGL
ncbi:hypothetical protein pb186bvf_009923 [Paramecium bursaria]